MNYKEFVTNTLKIKNGVTNTTNENGTKPLMPWKDVEPVIPIDSYEMFNPNGGISIVVPNGFMVIDVDSHGSYNQNENFITWAKATNQKTTIIKTRNGLHAWFKRGKHEGRHTGKTFQIGFTGDQLNGGLIHIEKSINEPFEVVYENGIGKLPKQLEIIGKQEIGDNLKTGEARNDALRDFMNCIGVSTSEEVVNAIKETRSYVINNGNKPPLTDKELFETVLRPESVQFVLDQYLQNKLDEVGVESLFDEKGKILWEHVIKRLERNPNVYVSSNGQQLYLFDNGTYKLLESQTAIHAIDNSILETIGVYNTTKALGDLLNALKTDLRNDGRIAPMVAKQPAVFNGMVVNWDDLTLRQAEREDGVMFDFGYPFSPQRNSVLESSLLLIAENDPVKLQQIKELFAWVLLSDNMGKAVVLQGGAGTGKSTIVKLLTHMTGKDGTSSTEWYGLNKPENVIELADKRLSINEDMGERGLKDATAFKRLVTNEPITGRKLYQQPVDFIYGGKMLATTNYTLTFNNGSEGVERRLFTLPINNRTIKHGDLTPLYEEMRERPNNLRNGLLYVVTDVVGDLLERGEFLISDEVKEAVKNTTRNSDPLVNFFEWYSDSLDEVSQANGIMPLTTVHNEYKMWSAENGNKALSLNTFKQRLEQSGRLVPRDEVEPYILNQLVNANKVKQFVQL